jgi:hypothetical protein
MCCPTRYFTANKTVSTEMTDVSRQSKYEKELK